MHSRECHCGECDPDLHGIPSPPDEAGAEWELGFRSGAWDRARAEVDETRMTVLADPAYQGDDDRCHTCGGGWQAHINGRCL